MAKYQITLEDGSKYVITTGSEEAQSQSQPRFNTFQSSLDRFLPGKERVAELQSQRRDSFDRLMEEVSIPFDFKRHPFKSTMKPLVTGLKTLAVPFQRLESGIAGAGLGFQNVNPSEAGRRFIGGITGQDQNELGDLIRTTGFGGGFNEPIASTAGLTATFVAPIKAMRAGLKSMSKIEKATDARLLRAGRQLVKGADDAVTVVGKKLDDVYSKINDVSVDGNKVIDDVGKLPDEIIRFIESEIGGNLDDFLQNMNIAKARQLKRLVGQFKPSAFGKSEKGAVELVQDRNINKAYSSLKQSIQNALDNVNMKREADALLSADDAFTETERASRFIKRTITDTTILKPTKTGGMALKLAKEGDLTGRTALNTLKSAGRSANRNVTKAVEELDRYNRLLTTLKFGQMLGRGVVFGGAAGAVGGRMIGENVP